MIGGGAVFSPLQLELVQVIEHIQRGCCWRIRQSQFDQAMGMQQHKIIGYCCYVLKNLQNRKCARPITGKHVKCMCQFWRPGFHLKTIGMLEPARFLIYGLQHTGNVKR